MKDLNWKCCLFKKVYNFLIKFIEYFLMNLVLIKFFFIKKLIFFLVELNLCVFGFIFFLKKVVSVFLFLFKGI